MDASFWCIAVIFNPAGYRSRIENYEIFRSRLAKQAVNVLTVELAFGEHDHVLDDAVKLRGNSIMWQKERLINHAMSLLPKECTKLAWLDADLLFPDGWAAQVADALDQSDFVQLFERIIHLDQGSLEYGGPPSDIKEGIVWQKHVYGDAWLRYRLDSQLGHAEPGFGWAARRDALGGLYDRLICGSGDNFLVDCLLDSSALHHYAAKLTRHMSSDMDGWKSTLVGRSVDFLPIDVYHLWHGMLVNRGYGTRELILQEHDYDPRTDIALVNGVWEWATDKPHLHGAIVEYFRSRREDG